MWGRRPGRGTRRIQEEEADAFVDAVAASDANVFPYYTTYDESHFLCSFMGYHANWHHELHADPSDPARNVTAGFIHRGYAMTLEDAILATEVTLRTVIDHVNALVVVPGDLNCNGEVGFDDINPFVLALSDPAAWQLTFPRCPALNGDLNADGSVSFADINPFVALLANP